MNAPSKSAAKEPDAFAVAIFATLIVCTPKRDLPVDAAPGQQNTYGDQEERFQIRRWRRTSRDQRGLLVRACPVESVHA